jgi:hypothetical protein
MKLMFDLPHGWTTRTERDWTTSGPLDRTLRILIAPLVERPRADIRRVLAHDLPPSARIDDVAPSPARRAHAGWEITTTNARVIDASGIEIEQRRIALYHVLWMVGAIMVIGRGDELERQHDLIERVLPSGRPHLWTEEPACVAEWFTMEPA